MIGLVALALAGCDQNSKAPPPLPVDQIPQALESAFKETNSESGEVAMEVISAMRSDEPVALESLQELSIRPDLSEEQRSAASRAMSAYLQKMRESAEKGDKKAEDALQRYRATK
jgi:hypothetical protein